MRSRPDRQLLWGFHMFSRQVCSGVSSTLHQKSGFENEPCDRGSTCETRLGLELLSFHTLDFVFTSAVTSWKSQAWIHRDDSADSLEVGLNVPEEWGVWASTWLLFRQHAVCFPQDVCNRLKSRSAAGFCFWVTLLVCFHFLHLSTSTPPHLREEHCTFFSTAFILNP